MNGQESPCSHGIAPQLRHAESTPRGQVSPRPYTDEHARAQLVREHYDWITKRCKQLMQGNPDALDVAQEVAIRMHRSLPHFEGRSSLRTWLSRIVHNECIDQIRREQRQTLTPNMQAQVAIHQLDWLETATRSEAATTAVHDTLQVLSKTEREVLHLRFFGDLPIAEIGALLGLSLSATKMRLYRAVATFREAYADIDDAPTPGYDASDPRQRYM